MCSGTRFTRECHDGGAMTVKIPGFCCSAGIPPLLGSPLGCFLVSLSRRFIPPRLSHDHSMPRDDDLSSHPQGHREYSLCTKKFEMLAPAAPMCSCVYGIARMDPSRRSWSSVSSTCDRRITPRFCYRSHFSNRVY